jgi:hypothetical protein
MTNRSMYTYSISYSTTSAHIVFHTATEFMNVLLSRRLQHIVPIIYHHDHTESL